MRSKMPRAIRRGRISNCNRAGKRPAFVRHHSKGFLDSTAFSPGVDRNAFRERLKLTAA
jgi:hypothetical protein